MQPLEYEKFIVIGYDDGADDAMMLLSPACPICRKSTLMRLSRDKMKKFIERAVHVQHLWPEATAEQRELLLTGSHPECWNLMFPPEDEDEEDDDKDDNDPHVMIFIDDSDERRLVIFMADADEMAAEDAARAATADEATT